MKKASFGFLLSIPLFIGNFCTSSPAKDAKQLSKSTQLQAATNSAKHVAVLELFTSQGCSSCPPADKLVADFLSKEKVIVLSFHVDYWDRLGWKDPFSSKEYSNRQYSYSSALHSQVYTPQLIINGQNEMIGSDEAKIVATIQKAQSKPTLVQLSIKSLATTNGKVRIDFTVLGNTNGAVLNIALVSKKESTDIRAGENSGVQLTNYNVVRNFKTISQVENGDNVAGIEIPPGVDPDNLSVMLFLQDKGNAISAADQHSL